MPNAIDVLLVLVFAVLLPLWSHFISWPKHERAVDAGDPRARSRAYVRTILEQWALVIAALVLMLANRRSLDGLWLAMPVGWRNAGFALALVYVALVIVQGRMIAAKPAALTKLRAKLQPLRALIPHTPGEFRLFTLLSLTAGICEEFLFRGYMVWVLKAVMGLYPAALLSMVAFGLAHGYQGGKFGFRAFMAGVAMGVLALATRSLLPSMLLHFMIDLGGGWVTYMAMSRGAGPTPAKVPNGVAA